MTYSLIGQLPRHLYVWVDSKFTHKEPKGFVRAVWFGLVSYPGRAWGCTVMLESGAVYRNLPPQALSFRERILIDPIEVNPKLCQLWDCYGTDFSVIEYDYLRGLDCLVNMVNNEFEGTYLFTVAPLNDGFSSAPEQAKEFVFVQLDCGYLTIQPTDRVVFRERSFTRLEMTFPTDLRRQTEVYSVE